jgi:DNA-binding transcriptional LysR family regulator
MPTAQIVLATRAPESHRSLRRINLAAVRGEALPNLINPFWMLPLQHDDLTAEFLCSDSMTVVAAPDSKWARRRKIELAELVDEPWCLPVKDGFAAAAIARAFRDEVLPRREIS